MTLSVKKEEKMEHKVLIPLNIQRFAECGEEETAKEQETEKKETVSNDSTESKTQDEKKYSDKELNDISTKNTSKAIAKKLKELGIDDEEKAKSILAKAKADEEASKSVDEKAQELTKERDKAKLEVLNTKIENALLRKGVSDQRVERAVRLVDKTNILDENGEIDSGKLSAEVEATIKDFPELISKSKEENKGFKIGGDGKEDKSNTDEELSSVFGN